MSNTSAKITGYRILETLYTGTRTLVYRALQESNNRPVVLKLLKNLNPRFQEVLQFRNQYTIAKNLPLTGIVHPYSLESYSNGYILVMEDVGGCSLKDYIATHSLSIDEFLAIAIQLTDILHGLYQNRVIHKDIKPANILIILDSKEVKLIDFSIATLLPKETQELQSINGLEGTLAYIAPEQTGRMNRGIDYRSDFYSLGVTFFELLTRKLPFNANDPLELVHCHIAKQPPTARSLNPDLPSILSDIVAKLMAKNAEDRYQTALGLKYDLEKCLAQWKANGKIEDFTLAQRDISDRFLIPEKLYGRETEVRTLLAAFARITRKNETNQNSNLTESAVNYHSELMLIAGFSGIGKTAVINEVHKPIVEQRGYFVKGKFDQFQRDIPLRGFVQAFQDLMQQLLGESDTQLEEWKRNILHALGDNGQVLIKVIPELKQIIGEQPHIPELFGTAAQNRFERLFQKFIQVFTTPKHPLVIFLDDLQWADSASLKLLQLLLADPGNLLVIGAYRDNEVSPIHPLMVTVNNIKKKGVTVTTVPLTPLQKGDVNQLIADTLSCAIAITQPLTELVYKRTQGNPFFTTQFIKALYEEGHIIFNSQTGYWFCDLTKIQTLSLTNDVVEFMVTQLQKLPENTQKILQLAACIGNQFDLTTLAVVAEESINETAVALWSALQEGLIIPISQTYKFFQTNIEEVNQISCPLSVPYRFLHDRVQQAAYSLIPDEQKQITHFKLGQRLLSNCTLEERNEKLFEIVNQLNQGSNLIVSQTELYKLAELNLAAGRKAKAATAYTSAFTYLINGIRLLKAESWQTQYDLTLMLYIEATEAAFLSSQSNQVDQLANCVFTNAKSILDIIKIYEIQIEDYTGQGKLLDAIKIALELLAKLGVTFPENPSNQEINQALEKAHISLKNRTIEQLLTLPEMSDAQALAILHILVKVTPSAFIATPALSILIICEQIYLATNFGNAPASAYSYSLYGLVLCGIIGDIETGFNFGQLALQLLDRFKETKYQARTLFIVNGFIIHWKLHCKNTLEPLKLAYLSGLENGDFVFAGYCAFLYGANSFYLGAELNTTEKEIITYNEVLKKINQQAAYNYSELTRKTIYFLQDISDDRQLNNAAILSFFDRTKDRTGLGYFYLYQLFQYYWFGRFEQAILYVDKAKEYANASVGMFNIPLLYFYDSLIQLANIKSSTKQQEKLERVALNQKQMQQWAIHAPMNYQHKYDLVEAERCRILGHKGEAIDLYDRAIKGAKNNEYVQEEALANELAAKFYLQWGKERIAKEYLINAYYAYSRWGAKAKAVDLENNYPDLLTEILQQPIAPLTLNNPIHAVDATVNYPNQTSSGGSSSASLVLDLSTIIKASQLLSSEIHLDKLLSTLLQMVNENAGANYCVFVLSDGQDWIVKAIAQVNSIGKYEVKITSTPLGESSDVPISLINIVKHTCKALPILNVTTHPSLAADSYIQKHQPKSVFSLPIIQQGKLIAILYLENTFTMGAFTSDRIQILNLLCTQAAISLENARLYQQLQTHSQQLEQSLEKLQLSEARYRYLATATSQIIWLANSKGENLDTIHWRAYTGQTEEEAKGNGWLNALHPDDIKPTTDVWLHAVENKTSYITEYRIRGADGIYRHFAVRGVPLLGEDGNIREWIGTCNDIDARKKAENKLLQKSQELEKTLQELQMMQLQLVQNEKMSALGNLVAGVAHEINNPIGFLAGNIQPALDYINDLFGLLDLYQEKLPDPGAEIEDEIDAIDLEYIREDLPKLIQSMQTGVDRIRNITNSLRTFSRADRDYKVPFNLHEGIDSTLLILKHRLKANEMRPAIAVTTDYGTLPNVECFPGQVNQVFMNLLANAIDALEEANHGKTLKEIEANPNQINVSTRQEGDYVIVQINDNGIGMSEEIKQKIFDHLFTTKAVGKGTGLGLAIARQIVEEVHGGKIKVNSTLGQGTEFLVMLPLA